MGFQMPGRLDVNPPKILYECHLKLIVRMKQPPVDASQTEAGESDGDVMISRDQQNLADRKRCEAFVRKTLGRYLVIGFGIPGLFVGFSLAHLSVLPLWIADIAVWPLSYLWPVLYENFNSIKEAGFPTQAANYILFMIVMVGFLIGLSVRSVIDYRKFRDSVLFLPPAISIGGSVLFFFFYVLLSHIQKINFKFRSLGEFYLDPYGVFYINQYLIVFSSLVCASWLLALALSQIFDPVTRKYLEW